MYIDNYAVYQICGKYQIWYIIYAVLYQICDTVSDMWYIYTWYYIKYMAYQIVASISDIWYYIRYAVLCQICDTMSDI